MKKIIFGIGISAIAVAVFVLGVYNQNLQDKDVWFGIDVNSASEGQSNFATSPATRNICDPSYPDICIAPFPPDLDCADIEFTNFRVYQPDPHGLDMDMDGVGCE